MQFGFLEYLGLEQWHLLIKILLSFFAGALIGLEREKAKISMFKEEGEVGTPPGVRSFGFISILGALSIVLPQIIPNGLTYSAYATSLPLIITVLTIMIIILYEAYRLLILKDVGITTPLALSLSYIIGVLIGLGRIIEAIATSVFVTFMLAIKFRIEALIRFITYEELLSALEIGIIVFLFGPFLAVDVYDPIFHVINFKTLYVFFVAIIVFSYSGYFLVKIKGPKAIQYFSFFGGLVHSEAAVISIVRLAETLKISASIVSGSIVVTSTAMIFRNTILTLLMIALTLGFENVSKAVFMVFILAYLIAVLEGYYLSKLSFISTIPLEEKIKEFEVTKPISYSIALKALLIFIVMLITVTYITLVFGNLGVLISAIFGGLISAEALIFTVFSLLSIGKIPINTALAAALLATGSAALNKLIFAKVVGAKRNVLSRITWQLLLLSMPVEIAGIYLAFFTR